MDGPTKVATLLLTLEPSVASEILSRFDKGQRTEIVDRMLAVDYIDHDTVEAAVAEFHALTATERHDVLEPKPRVRTIIENTFNEDEARSYLERQDAEDRGGPYILLGRLDAEQLADLLAAEHPQTIAIVLSRIHPAKAGQALSQLPTDLALKVVHAMLSGGEAAASEVIDSVGTALRSRVEAMFTASDPWATPKRRSRLVATVLDSAGRAVREAALDSIRQSDADMADQVRKLMFLFEDILLLDSDALRKVLSAVDGQTVALALKGASDKVVDHFFGAVSKRAAEAIREEQDLVGRRPQSEVNAAQEKIIDAIRRLRAEGEIDISRVDEEELL